MVVKLLLGCEDFILFFIVLFFSFLRCLHLWPPKILPFCNFLYRNEKNNDDKFFYDLTSYFPNFIFLDEYLGLDEV